MSHETEASRLLAAAMTIITDGKTSDKASVWGGEYAIRLAQVEATLYVGEQLERIADMMQNGYTVNPGDFGRLHVYPEPQS